MAKELKAAIVCDWLIGGGAERVVEQLHQLYPEAPIYTSYATAEWRQKLDGKVITGYLGRWPFSALRKFLPLLRGWWFKRLDLSDFDLVISSSGAEAKFVKVKKPAVHVSYIHAPTHYYWRRYDEYLAHPGFGRLNPLARLGLKILVGPLRKRDFAAAQKPDFLIANSNYTKSEIKKYYGRSSTVIHPPIDTKRFEDAKSDERHGFVVAGRQTPYKRLDLAVQACSKLSLPLIVIGRGPDNFRLLRLAGRSVTFKRNVNDEELPEEFARAGAFIFPGVDDFGIIAVEAMAAGTPVVAYKDGGALDYVIPGKTGEFFNEPSADSLAKTLAGFKPDKFNHESIKAHARNFSAANFRKHFSSFVKNIKIKPE